MELLVIIIIIIVVIAANSNKKSSNSIENTNTASASYIPKTSASLPDYTPEYHCDVCNIDWLGQYSCPDCDRKKREKINLPIHSNTTNKSAVFTDINDFATSVKCPGCGVKVSGNTCPYCKSDLANKYKRINTATESAGWSETLVSDNNNSKHITPNQKLQCDDCGIRSKYLILDGRLPYHVIDFADDVGMLPGNIDDGMIDMQELEESMNLPNFSVCGKCGYTVCCRCEQNSDGRCPTCGIYMDSVDIAT